MKYTSIIITSFISNELRAKMFRTSMESLLRTTRDLPVEIIVVDNGGDTNISDWLQFLTLTKEINCYVFNSENQHFGLARNQGIAMAKGEYVVIADNDIYYEPGWLEKCISILEEYAYEKIYATPIQYPTSKMVGRYDKGVLSLQGENYRLNMRAGSNCFVIRKKDLDIIGGFEAHRIAGSKWTDRATRLGYFAAVTPVNMVKDLGLRQGYDLRQAIPIERTLRNGEKIRFNTDELKP